MPALSPEDKKKRLPWGFAAVLMLGVSLGANVAITYPSMGSATRLLGVIFGLFCALVVGGVIKVGNPVKKAEAKPVEAGTPKT